MAPIPSPGQVVRVDMNFGIGTDVAALTRFYIQYTGSVPSAAELNTFCGSAGTAFGTDLKALMDTDSELLTVTAIDLSSDTGAEGEAAPAISGTRSGDYQEAASCFVVGYEIGRRYRGGHPRGYWRFGVYSDLTNPQTWDNTLISAVDTGIASFFGAIAGAGWSGAGTITQCNVSFYEGFTVVTSPTTGRARNVPKLRVTPLVNTITAYAGRPTVGSQRRRIHKVR